MKKIPTITNPLGMLYTNIPSKISVCSSDLSVLRIRLEYHVFNHADNPAAFQYLKLLPNNMKDMIGMQGSWLLYDVRKDIKRMEIPEDKFSLFEGNREYKLSPTYPSLLVTPSGARYDMIEQSCQFRSKQRFPSLVWYNKKQGNFILRSAQPLPGMMSHTSVGDENLISEAM